MSVTYKMPDLVNTLNNPAITEKDRSAIRWAIVTIRTLRHCDCSNVTKAPVQSKLTSEARA